MTAAYAPAALPDPVTHPALYAGVLPRRALAWGIDMVLTGLLSAMILPFTAFLALWFFPALFFVSGFFYRWATLAMGSATPGMAISGITIVRDDGAPLTGATAFWHTGIYSLSILMMPLHLISLVLMATGARGKSLGDHVLGTTAINQRSLY